MAGFGLLQNNDDWSFGLSAQQVRTHIVGTVKQMFMGEECMMSLKKVCVEG